MKALIVLAAVLMILPPTGCNKATTTTPATLAPGAYSTFDQQAFQVLSSSQATLNSLKASNVPQIKTALNQAILAYNAAEAAYQTFHAALAAGQQPSTAPVSTSLATLQTSISAVQTAATGAQ